MISEKSLSFENSGVLKGLFCVVAAQFFFTTQDMMIKWLSSDYALHQIILSRAVVGTLFILLVFVPMEGGISVLRTRRLGMHLMRGFGIVIANLAFFSSLISIKLGEATAIFFIAPVLITALSVVLLGEKVGHFRWIAVSVGLIGVMIMIRPRGEIFNAASLLTPGCSTGLCIGSHHDPQDESNRTGISHGILHPDEFCSGQFFDRTLFW